MAFGEGVPVEDYLFGAIGTLAAEDRVLAALFGTCVVVPVAGLPGEGRVSFLNPAHHFGIELLAEGLGGGCGGFGETVLRFEVRDGGGMVAVAEVKPVVDDGLAMSGSGPGGPGGEWRV